MLNRFLQHSRPSFQGGLFHYIKPMSHKMAKEIEDITLKYSLHLGSYEAKGLNYLLSNRFITIGEADFLANKLTSWEGRVINFQDTSVERTKFFNADYMDALIALIQDKCIPLEKAVATLQFLTCDQARGIANGLTREEVLTDNLSTKMGVEWTGKVFEEAGKLHESTHRPKV
jgi:hypothetical protein